MGRSYLEFPNHLLAKILHNLSTINPTQFISFYRTIQVFNPFANLF